MPGAEIGAVSAQVIKERAEEYGVSYASLVSILREQRVPASIAKQCCRLMVALYIEGEDHSPVEITTQTRVWSKVSCTCSLHVLAPRHVHARRVHRRGRVRTSGLSTPGLVCETRVAEWGRCE